MQSKKTNELNNKYNEIINKIIYDGSQMILCTTNGLYKSNNDFNSFSQISSTSGKTINQYSVFIDNKDILYYEITNGGL